MGTNGTNGQHTNGRLSSTANGRLSSTANEVDEDDFDPDDLGGETGVEEILAQDRDYNQFDEIIGCIEDIGGFQLLDLIMTELKSHMTSSKF